MILPSGFPVVLEDSWGIQADVAGYICLLVGAAVDFLLCLPIGSVCVNTIVLCADTISIGILLRSGALLCETIRTLCTCT